MIDMCEQKICESDLECKNIVIHAAVSLLHSSLTTAAKCLPDFDFMVHVLRCVSDAL